VKVAGVVLATALAIALQTTLGRFIRTNVGIDLVLVVVVYAGLSGGPVTGLITGTVAGLLQDALSSPIIGIGGLAKTVVGFLVGIVGTQFIVVHPLLRFVVFFAASLLHAAVFIGVQVLLGQRDLRMPYGPLAAQALANAVIGLFVVKLMEMVAGRADGDSGARIRR
jgi:rod shape-determining protein MreD